MKVEIQGERSHSIFAEVELAQRNEPRADFNFVPGEANAWKPGEFGCFAHVADIPKELREVAKVHPNEETERVIWKDRRCPRWSEHEPGVAPREQLQEEKARDFEKQRRAFDSKLTAFEGRQDRRLTKAAIWLASIIGLAQIIASLLTMGRDSAAYPWLHAALPFLFR